MHNFSSYLRCPELTATPYLSPPIQSPVTSNRQTTQSGRPSTATSSSIRQQKQRSEQSDQQRNRRPEETGSNKIMHSAGHGIVREHTVYTFSAHKPRGWTVPYRCALVRYKFKVETKYFRLFTYSVRHQVESRGLA